MALGYRDLYTRIHSDRVVGLSEAMGLRLGLPERDLGILRISANFHDIGKIGIPDLVLLKPGRLDEEETDAMRRHAAVGADIVLATELEGAEHAARVIRHHHERWDGNGYPDGLAGEEIPLLSRIIGIADSYDAMGMTRAYHRAKAHEEILAILRDESGLKHDPSILGVFFEIIETSPYRATGE